MAKYANALEDLNKAHKLVFNHAFTLMSRGKVKKMGMYAHALEDMNKAHELEPNVAFTLMSRWEVKKKMGQFESALR